MKKVVISFICIALFGCRSPNLAEWPDDIPQQSSFLAAYQADPVNQRLQSQQEYLGWILSFYRGSLVAPMGWLEVQERVLAQASPQEQTELKRQLRELGARIAAEWAKENNERDINNRMLSLWGSVLELSFTAAQRHRAIELIAADVDDLLSGRLERATIQDARYERLLGLELFSGF